MLADVLEMFRAVSMEKQRFVLDPAHYVSHPRMAWQAMLKKTGAELQLITDTAMYRMFECGMCRGVSMIRKRYKKANNKLIVYCNPAITEIWIIYKDANNRYEWAMSQCLPIGPFNWVDEETFKQIVWQAQRYQQSFGYIVECDLEYPSQVHEIHNDYPMGPEILKIQVEMLSHTQVECSSHYARARAKIKFKLVPNLMPKKKYVRHYLHLKFYMDHGMRLMKVH